MRDHETECVLVCEDSLLVFFDYGAGGGSTDGIFHLSATHQLAGAVWKPRRGSKLATV